AKGPPSGSRNGPRPSGLRTAEIGSQWNVLQIRFPGVVPVRRTMAVLCRDRIRRSHRIRNLLQVELLARSLFPKPRTGLFLQMQAERFPVSDEHPRPL